MSDGIPANGFTLVSVTKQIIIITIIIIIIIIINWKEEHCKPASTESWM